jgi:transposase-like protein
MRKSALDAKKETYRCKKCHKTFFDYVSSKATRDNAGVFLDYCNRCAPRRPFYRHTPSPDQQEFDFGE